MFTQNEESYNRTLDVGKTKKLAKSMRVSKTTSASNQGHNMFQSASEKKDATRTKIDQEKAEGTWAGEAKSERSQRKTQMKKSAGKMFH